MKPSEALPLASPGAERWAASGSSVALLGPYPVGSFAGRRAMHQVGIIAQRTASLTAAAILFSFPFALTLTAPNIG